MASWKNLVLCVCLVALMRNGAQGADETVVNSAAERETLTSQNKQQKKDTVLGYFDSMGSAGHKMFSEAASGFLAKFKFAVTSNKDAVRTLRDFNDAERSAVWFIKCTGTSSSAPCAVYKFKDNLDTDALTRFLRNVDQPLIIEANSDVNPFLERDIHFIYAFYDKNTRDIIAPQLEELRDTFYGIVGTLMINLDTVDAYLFGYVPQLLPLPGVTMYFRWREVAAVKPPLMHPVAFVHNIMSKIVKTDLGPLPDYGAVGLMGPPMDARLREDDQVVIAANQAFNRDMIDRKLVPELDDKTFYSETEKNNLMMVVFYMSITPPSVMALHHIAEAATTLAKQSDIKFGAVHCSDWTDVCAHEKITHYPTVRVYRRGQDAMTYKGLLAPQAFVDAAMLYNAKSPIELSSMADYDSYMRGDLPTNIARHTAISFVGLFATKSGNEFETFKTEAMKHDGLYVFAFATGDLAKQIAARNDGVMVPGVFTARRHDALQSQQTFSGNWNSETLNRFIDSQPLSLFGQLTVTNLPSYLAQKKPFVILFTPDANDEAHAAVSEVVKSQKFAQFTFGWMLSNDELAKSMLREYGAESAAMPTVATVNHATRAVYNFNQGMVTQYTLTNWLQSIVDGKTSPSKTLASRDWEPLLEDFDFLRLADEDEARKRQGISGPDVKVEIPAGKPQRVEL